MFLRSIWNLLSCINFINLHLLSEKKIEFLSHICSFWMLISASQKAKMLLKNLIYVILETVILVSRSIPLNFKHVGDMSVLSLWLLRKSSWHLRYESDLRWGKLLSGEIVLILTIKGAYSKKCPTFWTLLCACI